MTGRLITTALATGLAIMSLNAAAGDMEDAKEFIAARGCGICHTSEPLSRAGAPSFAAIAKRYATTPGSADVLVKSISKGVGGKWGGSYMMAPYDAADQRKAVISKVARFVLATKE